MEPIETQPNVDINRRHPAVGVTVATVIAMGIAAIAIGILHCSFGSSSVTEIAPHPSSTFFFSSFHSFPSVPSVAARRSSVPVPSPSGTLAIYKNGVLGIQRLRHNDTAFEGDQIQIQYQARGDYGAIFSVDGRGVVSLHYPNSTSDSTEIVRPKQLLPFAFELDDAPGFESFFFVTANYPIAIPKILQQVAKIDVEYEPLDLEASGMSVTQVLLHKLKRTQ